jgi:hypothetical protein
MKESGGGRHRVPRQNLPAVRPFCLVERLTRSLTEN